MVITCSMNLGGSMLSGKISWSSYCIKFRDISVMQMLLFSCIEIANSMIRVTYKTH